MVRPYAFFRKSKGICGPKKPPEGQISTNAAFFQIGSDLKIPAFEELSPDDTIGSVTDYISNTMGISYNKIESPSWSTLASAQPSLKHSLYYCFLKQSTIAHEKILFHRQDEEFVGKYIKLTAPYFIGAIPEDQIAKRIKLDSLKRQLRKIESDIDDINKVIGEGTRRGSELLAEARSLGLVDTESDPETLEGIVAELEMAQKHQYRQLSKMPVDAIVKLRSDRANKMNEYENLCDELEIAKSFQKDSRGFSKESGEQANRLASINLLDIFESDEITCPLCLKDGIDFKEIESDIRKSLIKLNSEIETATGSNSRVNAYIEEVSEKKRLAKEQIGTLSVKLQSAIDKNEEIKKNSDFERQQARTKGRISLYLESIELKHDIASLLEEKQVLLVQIKEIEDELDYENQQEVLNAKLTLISKNMSNWAKEFGMEYSGSDHIINLNKLTVQAITTKGPIEMNKMGSAFNWLGCHLITYFGLQHWFVNNNRPVPNFLTLDQPSQVWFPSEKEASSKVDGDWAEVKKMFAWLNSTLKSINGLQVILVDHIELDDDNFKACLRERWRDGNALVPNEWFN